MRTIQRATTVTALLAAFAFGAELDAYAQRRQPPDGGPGSGGPRTPALTALERVGQSLFFDTALSTPQGMSCASCHDAGAGWADPRSALDPLNRPTSEGVSAHRSGQRNAPGIAYGGTAPAFFYDALTRSYVGGRYWDGRAQDAIAQAKATLLDHLEMNNPGAYQIVTAVRRSDYATRLEALFGPAVWDDEGMALQRISEALTAYQNSHVLNGFRSRYDRYLAGDRAALTAKERAGLALFEGRGTCVSCHVSRPTPEGARPVFTSFRYYNLGVPRNPRNPFYDLPKWLNPEGRAYIDLGLGGAIGVAGENGKFKVPTLRNVALTPPYMHNGVFPTLYDAVMFHNTRDTDSRWGPPEVPGNIVAGPVTASASPTPEGPTLPPDPGDPPAAGQGRLGSLMLSAEEVGQIVAFLEALNDSPPAP